MASYTFEVIKTVTLSGDIIVNANSEDEAWALAEESAKDLGADELEVIDEDIDVEYISSYGDDGESLD